MAEVSHLRSLMETSMSLAAAAQPTVHSERAARHSFFASAHPERWHLAASRSGELTSTKLLTLLKRQHKLDLNVKSCGLLLARFQGLATGQDAAAMFDFMQASWEVFDSQEGAEQDLLHQAVAHAALPEVVGRLAGAEVVLEEESVRAALPDEVVDFDTFVLAVLEVHGG
jgi:hypothetical protein